MTGCSFHCCFSWHPFSFGSTLISRIHSFLRACHLFDPYLVIVYSQCLLPSLLLLLSRELSAEVRVSSVQEEVPRREEIVDAVDEPWLPTSTPSKLRLHL